MKYLLLFMFCISLSSFETSSHFVQNQVVLRNNNTITREKLSYKQRVMVKYLKLKARYIGHNRGKVLLILGGIFLVLGLVLISAAPNSANPANGCLGYVVGIVCLCISGAAFIQALITSLL